MNVIKYQDKEWLQLKHWIEHTKLFTTIKVHTNSGGRFGVMPMIVGVDPQLELSLQPGVVINVAEDLPIEIIEEFYRNSPFYKQTNQNQLPDGNQDTV